VYYEKTNVLMKSYNKQLQIQIFPWGSRKFAMTPPSELIGTGNVESNLYNFIAYISSAGHSSGQISHQDCHCVYKVMVQFRI